LVQTSELPPHEFLIGFPADTEELGGATQALENFPVQIDALSTRPVSANAFDHNQARASRPHRNRVSSRGERAAWPVANIGVAPGLMRAVGRATRDPFSA